MPIIFGLIGTIYGVEEGGCQIYSIVSPSLSNLYGNTIEKMKKIPIIMLNEKAYRMIKQMIFQKNLGPGQKLIYEDLCEALKMSRTPIINALHRLEQEGFLVSKPFRGFHIKPVDPQEAWELYGVREALEIYAIEQAVQMANDEDIQTLEEMAKLHREHMPAYYDQRKFILDTNFHIQIARISRNRILVQQLTMNLEHVQLRYSFSDMIPSRMPSAAKEHQDVLGYLKKRDMIGSIDAVRLHVRKARDHSLATLSCRPGLDDFEVNV